MSNTAIDSNKMDFFKFQCKRNIYFLNVIVINCKIIYDIFYFSLTLHFGKQTLFYYYYLLVDIKYNTFTIGPGLGTNTYLYLNSNSNSTFIALNLR